MKIQIENHNGRLRLRWEDGDRRQTLAIGMPDSALGRSVAESKKALIEEDWYKDRYDPTLVKYRPQTIGKTATIVTAPELFEKFAASKIKQEQLSQSSIERYQSIVKLLKKHLNQPAKQIGKSQVDRFVRVYGDKVSARTIKERCSLIQAAWDWGADKYQLPKDNPWLGSADRFKILPQQQVKPFTLTELQAIRAAFANHQKYFHYSDFVTFLIHTGCRFGEAEALRWKHLDTDYTTAWIGVSVSRGNHRNATKTGKDRTITLSPTISAFLAQRRDRLNPEPDDLVFPNSDGGAMNDNNFRNRQWREILALCQIEYRKPYAIRHSAIGFDLMAATKKRTDLKITQFPFVTTKVMVESSGLSADRLKHLRRSVLKEKIHWFHPPDSIRILWNAALVKDWLVNGNTPEHARAIESYLKSLPSSESA